MFTLSRSIRNCFLIVALSMLAGCVEDGPPLGPDAEPSFTVSSGRGGGSGSAPRVEEFDGDFDESAWIASDQKKLGHGSFQRANVSQEGGKLLLTLPGTPQGAPPVTDGAEIRSASRVQFRDIEVRLRTPQAPGSISAFFLYEFVQRRNDEIDIEILNDGSWEILFTTWVSGKQTNHARRALLFDPAAEFHDYRIEWSRRRVRFLVDGVLMQEWTEGVPRDAMYVMSNAWWPTWMNELTQDEARTHEIDRIIY